MTVGTQEITPILPSVVLRHLGEVKRLCTVSDHWHIWRTVKEQRSPGDGERIKCRDSLERS